MVSDLSKSLSTMHSLPVELKVHGVGGHAVLLLLQDRNLHTDTHTHTHFQVKALWDKDVRCIHITESSPPRNAKNRAGGGLSSCWVTQRQFPSTCRWKHALGSRRPPPVSQEQSGRLGCLRDCWLMGTLECGGGSDLGLKSRSHQDSLYSNYRLFQGWMRG